MADPPVSNDEQPDPPNGLGHAPPDKDATIDAASDASFLSELQSAWDNHGQSHASEEPIIEGYEIQRELNRGGQGVVYEAMQIATHRRVALKVLLHGAWASPRQRLRFEREAELAAALTHPDIVSVWDSGVTESGCGWIAMEFVDGKPLHEWLDAHASEHTATRRRHIAGLIARIAEATAAAHRRGIIHRDLKPANILVDQAGCPHVLDFGLAKPLVAEDWSGSEAVTAAGEFMGTFAYAAPEQVSGDPDAVDARTDVWALGVILYESLLGQPPLALDGGLSDIVSAIKDAHITPPRSIDPMIDRDLETMLLRALDGDPDRRTAGPGDLAKDLRHWLAGEAIEARRDDQWYVAGKFLRRHWLAVSGAALAISVLIGFAVTMWVMYDQATEANNRFRSTLSMTWDVLATADAENPDQPLAASNLSEMMQRWSSILESELEQYPEIAAQMQLAVGRTLMGRGRLDEAQVAFAAAAQGIDLDQPSLEAAELLHEMGRLHYKQATWNQAVEAYRTALTYRRALLGIHEDTATSWHHLGAALRFVGALEEGRDALAAAVHMRRALLETASDAATRQRLHLAVANGLNSIAVALSTHQPEIALPLLVEALDLMLAEGIDESADWRIASLRHNIGMCMVSLNRLDEAGPMLAQALQVKMQQGNVLQIANTQFELARLALHQGNLHEATNQLTRAINAQRTALPNTHPVRMRSALLDIELAIELNQLDQASVMLAKLGTISEHTRDYCKGLLAMAQSDPSTADGLLQRSYRGYAAAHGPTSPAARRAARAISLLWAKDDPATSTTWHDRSIVLEPLPRN